MRHTAIFPATIALAATFLMAGPAFAQTTRNNSPLYTAGSQYTASFAQTGAAWRLHPGNGQDIRITTGSCQTGAMAEPGLWLVVPDGHGHLDLVAPSTTPIRAGYARRVALRACDEATGSALAVPQTVLDLLTDRTSAVYISE